MDSNCTYPIFWTISRLICLVLWLWAHFLYLWHRYLRARDHHRFLRTHKESLFRPFPHSVRRNTQNLCLGPVWSWDTPWSCKGCLYSDEDTCIFSKVGERCSEVEKWERLPPKLVPDCVVCWESEVTISLVQDGIKKIILFSCIPNAAGYEKLSNE